MSTYNITTVLNNCTADAENPTTIESDGTAELEFTALSGFPFNSFKATADNAKTELVLSTDKKTATVTLSEATDDVALTVEAEIEDNDINDSYVVKNGVLYRIFNGRTVCKWNSRWCRENL